MKIPLLLLCILITSALHSQRMQEGEININIKAVDGLQFDVVRFMVKPGTRVTITLTNESDMGHNLLITKPGKRLEVVNAALQLAGKGPEKNYVPDSESVLWSIPVLSQGQEGKISFRAPDDQGAYPYVCTYPGHGFVMYGVMYVSNENTMPDIATDTNVPDTRRQEEKKVTSAARHANHDTVTSPHPYVLTPPYLYHAFLPGAGPAAIAVNLPRNISYCWDAGTCSLRYAWKGGFVDMSDIWKGHFDASARISGDIFFIDNIGYPLRSGKNESLPKVEYKGYRLVDRYPEFHYTLDGTDVYEIIRPDREGTGLVREFNVPKAKNNLCFNIDHDEAIEYQFSGGKVANNKLMLSPSEAKKFTVIMKSYHLLYKRRTHE